MSHDSSRHFRTDSVQQQQPAVTAVMQYRIKLHCHTDGGNFYDNY